MRWWQCRIESEFLMYLPFCCFPAVRARGENRISLKNVTCLRIRFPRRSHVEKKKKIGSKSIQKYPVLDSEWGLSTGAPSHCCLGVSHLWVTWKPCYKPLNFDSVLVLLACLHEKQVSFHIIFVVNYLSVVYGIFTLKLREPGLEGYAEGICVQ